MSGLSFARIAAVMVKEFTQLRRDRITYAMILVMPLMQLLLFGYAINTDPRHMPAAVLSHDHGRLANAVVATLERTTYVDVKHVPASEAEMDRLMRRGEITRPDDPARLQRARPERRPGADPGRSRCHGPHSCGRRCRGGRDSSVECLPVRTERPGRKARVPSALRSRGAPALQSRGHHLVQHRAGPAGDHPFDDAGDDDRHGCHPRGGARHDGEPAVHPWPRRSR